jgi:hypothetical protein
MAVRALPVLINALDKAAHEYHRQAGHGTIASGISWGYMFKTHTPRINALSKRLGPFCQAFNGGTISVTGCSGSAGSCRNNPAAQCKKSCGPLPRGTYRLSADMTYKGASTRL